MRSELSGAIFQDELLSLYREKDLSYLQVRDTAMEAMSRLIREMKSGLCDSPVIAGADGQAVPNAGGHQR